MASEKEAIWSEDDRMKYWLKQCPKCRGDLRVELDIFGEYVACMQCGYALKQEEEQQLMATGKLNPEPVREPVRQ